MNIHDFVNGLKARFEIEMKQYLYDILNTVAKQLSQEYSIPENELRITIHKTLDHSMKKCTKITKQGHQCKYGAKVGEDLCIKHTNMI